MSTPIRRAIYGRLSGDTTLSNLLATPPTGYAKSIYHQQAPEGAGFPFIVMNKQSGFPTETMSDPDALENDTWLVKGIDRGTSADTVEAIADRVRVLLNDASLSISGGTLLYLRRQSDTEYAEVTSGVTYHHAGALYRLVFE